MDKLLLYFRLKGISYYRMLKQIPFLYLILFFAVISVVVYGIIITHIAFSQQNTIICLLVFLILCHKLFRISDAEKVLLNSLHLDITTIQTIQYLIVSLLFFTLNIYIGIITSIIAVLFAFIQSNIQLSISKKIFTFYKKTSYQWLSSFRQEGIWLFLAELLLFIIALYNKNQNMVCAIYGLLICLPCFLSYYKIPENRTWLIIYKNSSFLLQSKLIELFINTTLPIVFYLILTLAFMPESIFMLISFTLVLYVANMLLFYCYYLCYPSMLMSLVSFACLFCIIGILFMINSTITIASVGLLLVVLHITTIHNIKSNRHVIITEA